MSNLLSIKQRFGIIGKSELLDRALDTAIRVAPTDLTVLLTGESGVGKEVFSKVIHSLSARKHNGFIAINCGAIPEGTINSELFGHEKGSFTGATAERKGYFEAFDGGTIFLDEIGEMPADTQSYLLRILENGEFIRVGASKVQKTDVRIIAATNVTLEDLVKKGKFREDLFYRLSTVPIKIPALRERQEDIFMLFRKFAVDFAEKHRMEAIQLDEKAENLLVQYRWPGNVRELKNVAEQLSVLAQNRLVTEEQIIQIMPQILKRNLPAIKEPVHSDAGSGFQEREILYKLLFDMKNDLNDLKSVVYDLIRTNDLQVAENQQIFPISGPVLAPVTGGFESKFYRNGSETVSSGNQEKPILIDTEEKRQYEESEVVEESLSIADNEKELIRKALRKHQGKRKEAAVDLGISERTLYRKIKEYDL